ncbi:DUF1732 domain-containing protein [Fodinicurvata sp. EGI_FJ10296]|uniref:YicC family protein n=1 Tax=Fodinicurvata sp. EGI_FJ10296 TaxID=3231908 RepID=UPI0034565551
MTTPTTPPSTGASAGTVATPIVVSMTGFARVEGGNDRLAWIWEARSVNGRGLDIRTRYPQGLDAMDGIVRSAATPRFRRGTITVSLTLRRPEGATGYAVNEALLDQLVKSVLKRTPYDTVSVESLLSVRGVVEQADPSAAEMTGDDQAEIEADLGRMLETLAASRAGEGGRLGPVLGGQVSDLRAQTREAATTADMQPAHIQEKLNRALADLLGPAPGRDNAPTDGSGEGQGEGAAAPGVNPERLAQEVALLASKADVREELDRLNAHLDQAEELLASGQPVGRQLDFLCQELNREANTLCSKASTVALTRIGMAMKAGIEQFREQVQNVE